VRARAYGNSGKTHDRWNGGRGDGIGRTAGSVGTGDVADRAKTLMRPPSYHRKNSPNVRKRDDQSLAKCPLRLPVEDNCTPLNHHLRVENEDDV
jgi:hypothetical protein